MLLDTRTRTVAITTIIAITNEPGHFPPPSAPDETVELVREILPKPGNMGKAGIQGCQARRVTSATQQPTTPGVQR